MFILWIALSLCACGGAAASASRAVSQRPPPAAIRDSYPDPNRTLAVTPRPTPAPTVPLPAALPPSFNGLGSVRGFAWLSNRLVSADGSLNVAVGSYTDCTGNSPIDSDRADLDPCFPGRLYFVGHHPGVFTPLMAMRPGAILTWYDAAGNPERLRIVAVRDVRRNWAPLTLSQPDVVAEFQTCVTADGSIDRILDAVRD